jgi:hypothetical protein
MTKLALVDVVRQLRVDLANAVAEAAGEMIQFEVGPIEAELSVEFEREGKVGGKITAWVVEFSGEAKMTETRGHRIKLSLQPLSDGGKGKRLLIGGRQGGRPE